MAGHYAIDGSTMQIKVHDEKEIFVGAMMASCGMSHCRDTIELELYASSAADEPIVTIIIPKLWRERFFAYVAGACSAMESRDIQDEMDAEEAAEEEAEAAK